MAKYNIHRRKSTIDKNTEIVDVTKEKSLSEKLLGSEDNKDEIKSGRYRVHERTSLLDKNTKIVDVTREKTLSDTLFGTEEEREEKEKQDKLKYEAEKEKDKQYIKEQNQKMIDSYNEILEMDKKIAEQRKRDNTVVDKDYSEDITYEDVKKKEKEFDYKSVPKEKIDEYLKYVAKYLNARDKGYTIEHVTEYEKKKTKVGPKYWVVKTDKTESYMNVGAKVENKSIILDEEGTFRRLTETIVYKGKKPSVSRYFADSKDFNWELVCLDIFIERQNVGFNLEEYLKMTSKEKEDLIKKEEENWTEASLKLKEKSLKKSKNEKIKKNYKRFLLIGKILSFPLVVLPIVLVVIKVPLELLIIFTAVVGAIYGYTKQDGAVINFLYYMSLIITSILLLIRGYNKAFRGAVIMVVASLVLSFIFGFIEGKITKKIDELD